MDLRLNWDSVFHLVCAVFLASAIGFTALGGSASSCAAPRLERGDSVPDTGAQHRCGMSEHIDAGRGRPGMRLMPN
jgi:hypothetical protein